MNVFTCGESTFDLEALIDQKKVIIFNLNKSNIGEKALVILGQFVTSITMSYAYRRNTDNTNPKTPVHIFADEAQYFLSNEISTTLQEARKFRVYLTMATQSIKQLDQSTLSAFFTNVGCFSFWSYK